MPIRGQSIDRAREKIRQALVYEYLKKHPGVREQDVVMACRKGELLFTEISAVLADAEFRKQSNLIFKQANSMFAELAIHQDERWLDCVESVRHCVQIVDCLHSSLFACLTNEERAHHETFVKSQERLCARITVRLHEASKLMKNIKGIGRNKTLNVARGYVINFLNHTIDQLKVLHTVLNREVELGDTFGEQAVHFLESSFDKILKKTAVFRIEDVSNLLKALKGEKKITLQSSFELNENILFSSKNSLRMAVDELKTKLSGRRKQIQELWSTISLLQSTVNNIKEIDELNPPNGIPPRGDSPRITTLNRMVRFLERFTQVK